MASEFPAAMTITLFVTHSNLSGMNAETKLSTDMLVGKLRDKLYMSTGTAPASQLLTLKDSNGVVAQLDDDTKPLGFYFPADGMELHVTDTDPTSITAGGALDDTSAVEKFKLSSDAYDKAGGSDFRKFRAARAKGRGPPITDDFQAEEAKALEVGSRCQLKKTGRRGVIKFVGHIPEIKKGFWVGVELDEPTGKNSGSVKGVEYFECRENHGVFARPKGVEQGDFPEIDILADDDEEDDI